MTTARVQPMPKTAVNSCFIACRLPIYAKRWQYLNFQDSSGIFCMSQRQNKKNFRVRDGFFWNIETEKLTENYAREPKSIINYTRSETNSNDLFSETSVTVLLVPVWSKKHWYDQPPLKNIFQSQHLTRLGATLVMQIKPRFWNMLPRHATLIFLI